MNFPLLDESDLDILMHRDVHFAGSFREMLDYYKKDGVGVNEEFTLERIQELNKAEQALGENLSKKLLPSHCFEEVTRAKELYLRLRDVYETTPEGSLSQLLSNLILSEDDPPEEELNALIKMGPEAVNGLIHIIDSTDFYNTLYPGYGRTPMFAAQALASIGDQRAIRPLFHALRNDSFEIEEALHSALRSFGSDAKAFLLQRVQKKPYSRENELAASSLSLFLPDEEIQTIARNLLNEADVQKKEVLASYLECLLDPV